MIADFGKCRKSSQPIAHMFANGSITAYWIVRDQLVHYNLQRTRSSTHHRESVWSWSVCLCQIKNIEGSAVKKWQEIHRITTINVMSILSVRTIQYKLREWPDSHPEKQESNITKPRPLYITTSSIFNHPRLKEPHLLRNTKAKCDCKLTVVPGPGFGIPAVPKRFNQMLDM